MHQVLLLNLDDMHTCMCDNAVFIWLVMLHDYDLFSDPLHRAFYSERKCICRTAFKDTLLLVPGRSWLDENFSSDVDIDLLGANIRAKLALAFPNDKR